MHCEEISLVDLISGALPLVLRVTSAKCEIKQMSTFQDGQRTSVLVLMQEARLSACKDFIRES